MLKPISSAFTAIVETAARTQHDVLQEAKALAACDRRNDVLDACKRLQMDHVSGADRGAATRADWAFVQGYLHTDARAV